MYSAKKHQGRKLYELARKGEEVERKPVRITVYEFETTGGSVLHKNADGTANLNVRVVCSAGTYVRTLAEDFGKQLGIGAHLRSLRRTRAGDFTIDKAITLEELQQRCEDATVASTFLAMDAALSRLPFVHLTDADAQRVRQGLELRMNGDASAGWPDGSKVRLRTSNGELLAIGIFDLASEMLRPRVVLAS
jgi:tRNA pseudouridine55 synthase